MSPRLERLTYQIQRSLAVAQFDVGRAASYPLPQGTTNYGSFGSPAGRPLGPKDLRDMYRNAVYGDGARKRIVRARIDLPDQHRADMNGAVKDALRYYIRTDDDHIGLALPLPGINTSSHQQDGSVLHEGAIPVSSFASRLLVSSAIQGVDSLVSLIRGWLDGEPLRYRICHTVPLYIDSAIKPLDGLRIEPLPLSTNELPADLPLRRDTEQRRYLGQTLVSIDATVEPVFFRPVTGSAHGTAATRPMADPPSTSLDIVWEALSLELDRYIEPDLQWWDYSRLPRLAWDDATVKRSSVDNIPGQWSTRTHVTTFSPSPQPKHLCERGVRELLLQLTRAERRTRIASARWRKSKDWLAEHIPERFKDSLIELRIALEATFLGRYNKKVCNSVTKCAAELLNKHNDNLEAVGRAYGIASKVIHSRESIDWRNAATIRSEAQSICREGILKILRNGSPSHPARKS